MLLGYHFDEYFIPISSIHSHSTRLATSEERIRKEKKKRAENERRGLHSFK